MVIHTHSTLETTFGKQNTHKKTPTTIELKFGFASNRICRFTCKIESVVAGCRLIAEAGNTYWSDRCDLYMFRSIIYTHMHKMKRFKQ